MSCWNKGSLRKVKLLRAYRGATRFFSLLQEIKKTLSGITRVAVKKFGERAYIILNSGDITKRYSVDAQNLIPAKFSTLEVLLMGKWYMMSAKKLKSPPFSPPFASATIRFHSDPPSHVIQQTFINELQRTILYPLERRSFGIFFISFDSEINVLIQ